MFTDISSTGGIVQFSLAGTNTSVLASEEVELEIGGVEANVVTQTTAAGCVGDKCTARFRDLIPLTNYTVTIYQYVTFAGEQQRITSGSDRFQTTECTG